MLLLRSPTRLVRRLSLLLVVARQVLIRLRRSVVRRWILQ
jgi:hypothetical protein